MKLLHVNSTGLLKEYKKRNINAVHSWHKDYELRSSIPAETT